MIDELKFNLDSGLKGISNILGMVGPMLEQFFVVFVTCNSLLLVFGFRFWSGLFYNGLIKVESKEN